MESIRQWRVSDSGEYRTVESTEIGLVSAISARMRIGLLFYADLRSLPVVGWSHIKGLERFHAMRDDVTTAHYKTYSETSTGSESRFNNELETMRVLALLALI